MVSGTSSASRASWCGLVVALAGLGVLVFGDLLFYYADTDAHAYRWKGPVGAVVIVTVCVAAVVALQHPALPGWVRGLGYVAAVPVVSFLAFVASATYYEERCDDPTYVDPCGLPIVAAMLWAAAAAVFVIALVVVGEFLTQRRIRRLPTD